MKSKLTALCGSFVCTGKNNHQLKNKDFVIKNVSISAKDCPDCGHSLRWISGSNRRYQVITTKKYIPMDEQFCDLNSN